MAEAPKRKVLIVDQDVLSVIQAEQVLREAGYQVERLLSGAGLFAKLEYDRPDIVLLDINIPHLSFASLYERLHAGGYDELVLVLFSAQDPEELRRICLENEQINGYFSKSIEMSQLPSFIESFFGE